MTVSVLVMAFDGLVIAVCPSYSSIGVAAPTILVLARVLLARGHGEFEAPRAP